jgi:hypothetical protein
VHVLVADVLNAQLLLKHFNGEVLYFLFYLASHLDHLFQAADLALSVICEPIKQALLIRLRLLEYFVLNVGLMPIQVFKVFFELGLFGLARNLKEMSG